MSNAENTPIIPIILCGGSGTRLWPVSRQDMPKQFSSLLPGDSMFQQTLSWLRPRYGFAAPILVANQRHQDLVEQQSLPINNHNHQVIYEPFGRNTAASVLCAALLACKKNPQAIMLSMPSDHILAGRTRFAQAIETGRHLAQNNRLVLFGITPDNPSSAYGYIMKGKSLDVDSFCIAGFTEKPDTITAQKMLDNDSALWNSGMLLFKASKFVSAMRQHQAKLLEQCRAALKKSERVYHNIYLNADIYADIEDLSLDHGLLEKAKSIACVRAGFRWSDAGSWNAIAALSNQEINSNVLQGDAIQRNCRDTYLRSENRLVAAVGVENLVVIETADAVLVADRGRIGDIKGIVEQMKGENRREVAKMKGEERPWGGFSSIDEGNMHQVKHIVVNPGGVLSLQKHHFRSEHWVVVEGRATVTICGETSELTANQSVYIPKGAVHRLENETDQPLHLIEVQYGAYLGEDDIERLEDTYGRSTPMQPAAVLPKSTVSETGARA